MTDLEMTKLCAEAMGMDWEAEQKRMADRDGKWLHGYEKPRYDPLHNDELAMALVKRFKVFVEPPYSQDKFPAWEVSFDEGPDMARARNADLNRAIVESVAKMQSARTQ